MPFRNLHLTRSQTTKWSSHLAQEWWGFQCRPSSSSGNRIRPTRLRSERVRRSVDRRECNRRSCKWSHPTRRKELQEQHRKELLKLVPSMTWWFLGYLTGSVYNATRNDEKIFSGEPETNFAVLKILKSRCCKFTGEVWHCMLRFKCLNFKGTTPFVPIAIFPTFPSKVGK